MSNKSRSRRRKENKKLIMIELFKTCLIYRMAEIQRQIIASQPLPKLATGGTVYGDFKHILIKGGEMVVPVVSKGGYMNDNDQYMFQND